MRTPDIEVTWEMIEAGSLALGLTPRHETDHWLAIAYRAMRKLETNVIDADPLDRLCIEFQKSIDAD